MPGLVEQQQQPGAGGSAGAAKPGGGSSGALAAAQRSPPVEWGRELAQLAAGEEWAELAGELEASAGGGALVAALMRRALRAVQQAAEAAAAAEGQQAGAGAPAPLPGGATAGRLVAAAQQVAWEKLHSGCWHEVGVAWRDAYSLACLLAAAAAMLWPPPAPPAAGQAEAGAAQAEGLRAALRELDMAAIMGGPLFRPAIDRLISRLQDAWQRLAAPQHAQQAQQQQPASGAGATAAAGAAAGASGDTGGATRGAQPMEAEGGGSGSGSGGGGSEEEGSGALVEAVEAGPVGLGSHGPVPLPPGSMGPRGTPVPLEELPSLERFWREYMHREGGSIPVLIEGGRAAARRAKRGKKEGEMRGRDMDVTPVGGSVAAGAKAGRGIAVQRERPAAESAAEEVGGASAVPRPRQWALCEGQEHHSGGRAAQLPPFWASLVHKHPPRPALTQIHCH